MNNTTNSLDIIRAYELSWLATSGKPQLGLLEIYQITDTWRLKNFLESINNTEFANLNALIATLEIFLGTNKFKIFTHEQFTKVNFLEQQNLTGIKLQYSLGIRFICKLTGQPYIGSVNVLSVNNNIFTDVIINRIITSLRNTEYLPLDLVDALFTQLQAQTTDEFVLSVHLNRRGGISQQFLRCNNASDVSQFNCRSVLE